jgi:hypothetical protein
VLSTDSAGSDAYVEADPQARRLFVAAAAIAVGVAVALAFFALRASAPAPVADPALELPALAQRALWSALLATAFGLAAGITAVRIAAQAVRTRQWPPAGMRVPFRTRVQLLPRPAVAWGVAAMIVLALFVVALLYWLHYFEAREFASMFAK